MAWVIVYPTRLLLGHAALRTNAFDLSVFDYALWSSLSGSIGYVPFLGQSLFSHHFMPTLLVVLPAYALWPSTWFLVVLQIGAVLAGWLLYRALLRTFDVPAIAATALLFAFLFSRYSHGAVMGVFYLESLEPALVLWMIWAWARGYTRQYWAALILALGCKEDMALYVGAFGLLLMLRPDHRRLGLMTTAVAAVWLVLSVFVIVPAVRQSEGLTAAYPFFEARYQTGDQASVQASVVEAAGRVFSVRSLRKIANVASSVALVCLAAPGWFAVMLPGMLVGLAARPDTMQSAFVGHYFWPFFPWLFVAGAIGATRLRRYSIRSVAVAGVLVWLVTIANSPLWTIELPDRKELAITHSIRQALGDVPADAAIWVAPNLLPHIPHRSQAYTLGGPAEPAQANLLAFSTTGNLWPLETAQLARLAEACQEDSSVVRQPAPEPLMIFTLTERAFRDDNPCVRAVRVMGDGSR